MDRYRSLAADSMFASHHIALLVTDAQRRIVAVSPYAQHLLGYTEGDLLGQPAGILYGSDEDYRRFSRRIRQAFRSGKVTGFEMPFRHRNGATVWLSVSGARMDAEGHALWFGVDISKQKHIEEELRILKERLEFAIEGNRDIVWDWDLVRRTFDISKRWQEMVGYDRDDLPYTMRIWRQHVHPEDRPKVIKGLRACLDGTTSYLDATYRVQHTDGHTIWVLQRALALYDNNGRAIRMVGTLRDITRTKELEMRLVRQSETIERQRDALWHGAHYDVLTELPNRIYFQELFQQAICDAEIAGEKMALLFLDLDHFKNINDTYGHGVGDDILRYTASRIIKGVRQEDTVARIGGDEFLLMIRNIPDAASVERLVVQLMQQFDHPYVFSGGTLHLTASIGIAIYPQDGADAETLLRHADQAMYRVKESGRGAFRFYRAEAGA